MLSARTLRRLAVLAAAGALTVATSQARTFIPTAPEPAPQVTVPQARPATRPATPAVKKVAAVDPASCQKVRRKLWVEGEGWIVRSVSRCV